MLNNIAIKNADKESNLQKFKWVKNELLENATKYSKDNSSIKYKTVYGKSAIYFEINNNITDQQLEIFEKFSLKIENGNTRELFANQLRNFDPKASSSQLGLLLIKKDQNNKLQITIKKEGKENIVSISLWMKIENHNQNN